MKLTSTVTCRLCAVAIVAIYFAHHDALRGLRWFGETSPLGTLVGDFDDQKQEPAANLSEDRSLNRQLWVQQPPARGFRETQDVGQRSPQRNHYVTLRAFREAIGDTWKSTVQVLDGNKQIALGAVVRSDGWIVTKASEIPDRAVDIKLFDGTKAQGQIQARRPEWDLALIKIDRSGLPTIAWNETSDVPLGGWLASADVRSMPLAIGVVSVKTRNVRSERSVLGVSLGEAKNGALVQSVVSGSGAANAGVQDGDVINEIDGQKMANRTEVLNRLSLIPAGQRLKLGLQREGRQISLDAQMMDLHNSLLDETEMEVNGRISARSTGFRNILQHDTVLAPNQCGGPLVDVQGNVIGLNIARAGRISSYALPAKIVGPAIADMLTSVKGELIAQDGKVVPASAIGKSDPTLELPASIPEGIRIESLKPEVILPSSRP